MLAQRGGGLEGSLKDDSQKRKTVVKIEFTPLSHCNILPFFKGFKKIRQCALEELMSDSLNSNWSLTQ